MENKMSDLYKRVLSSFAFVIIVLALINFSSFPFFRFIIALVCAGLALLNCYEYLLLIGKKGIKISFPLMLTAAVCLPLSFLFYSPIAPLLVALGFFLTAFLVNFQQINGAFERISFSLFGFIYAIVPIGIMYAILYSSDEGKMWLLYLLVVTKMADIGAYIGGKLLGKRKLAINISPNKTIEGGVAGFILSFCSSLLFIGQLGLTQAIFLGIILALLSQVGDLCESLLKRDVQVKDSNKLPGLGGFLDVFDSLVFNAFFLYFYLIF
jgi:phosphatidate cytidylyltransferase